MSWSAPRRSTPRPWCRGRGRSAAPRETPASNVRTCTWPAGPVPRCCNLVDFLIDEILAVWLVWDTMVIVRLCHFVHRHRHTGVTKRVLPRLQECSRQVETEVVSNSSNKIQQTWEALFWIPLYRRATMPNNFDFVPMSLSLTNHTECSICYLVRGT